MLDLFTDLAAAGGEIVVGAWVAVCMSIWNGGLFLLGLAMDLADFLTRPNLNPEGATGLMLVYSYALWLAGFLALVMFLVQLISAVTKRDGKSLGDTVAGTMKFLMVCVTWYAYAAAIVVAVDGVNTALRHELLGTGNLGGIMQSKLDTIGEGMVTYPMASVLMLLGFVLVLAAIAFFLILLGRAVTLIVLAATVPLAAAGLLHKPTERWFWKSFQWFHAAAVAPIFITLILGLGIQTTSGAVLGAEDSAQNAIAMAFPGVLMVLISAVSPLALFKLLSFVDPGTSSGATFRAGLSGLNGVEGGLGRLRGSSSGGSEPAASSAGGQQALAGAGKSNPAMSGSMVGAGSSTSAAAGGSAVSGGVAAGLGPAGVAIMGAQQLVTMFKTAGAVATGMVTDTAAMMGAGDGSFSHDPAQDSRSAQHPIQRMQTGDAATAGSNPTPPYPQDGSANVQQHPPGPQRRNPAVIDSETPNADI